MMSENIKIMLDTVGKIKISFNIIVNDEEHSAPGFSKPFPPTVNRYYYAGNNYLQVTGSPYIKLDFSFKKEKKQFGLNKNMYLNLRRIEIFRFRKSLSAFIERVYAHKKEIFIKDEEGNIMVDNNIVASIEYNEMLDSKHVCIRPCVIPNQEIDFDEAAGQLGYILYVNNISDYTYLTLEELEYLYHIIRTIDIYSMMIQAITMYLASKGIEVKDLGGEPSIEAENVDRSRDTDTSKEGYFSVIAKRNEPVLPSFS